MGKSFDSDKDNLNSNEINLIARLTEIDYHCLCRGIGQLAVSRSSFLGSSIASCNELMLYKNTDNETYDSLNKYRWKIILKVGVLILSQHRKTKRYYIQAIDMVNEKVVINHQVEHDTQFKRKRRFILTFETKLGTFCINFIDDDEADIFVEKLEKVL